nr:capsid protein [Cressdnaviricota sp.]BDF97690.1 capsid protein [Cressdnaviricota sp.]
MAFKRYRRFKPRSFRKRGRFGRYRRRYYRRSRSKRVGRYRRFPKYTETKVGTFSTGAKWNFVFSAQETASYGFKPMHAACIPKTPDTVQIGIPIINGTDNSSRIGNKISPLKLRLSGALSFSRNTTEVSNNNLIPGAFALRCIIYQVRGGNGTYNTANSAYHPLAITTDADGFANATQCKKLYGTYSVQSNNETHTIDDLRKNIQVAKGPLRLGIGGQMRMLYNKTYTLQTGTRTSIPFRIVTKIPRRFIWAEVPNGADAIDAESTCRNAVFITWTLIPMNPQPVGDITMDYQCDLFYTDK